jgi:sulfite reductase (NADPH) flavoprotein alpha-component
VIGTLSGAALSKTYTDILKVLSKAGKKADAEVKAANLLEALNSELGTTYKLFEYSGHDEADHVLVVFGSVEASLAKQVSEKLSREGNKVGVVNVRVYRPFSEEAFLESLPASAQRITVLGQVLNESTAADESAHSSLYEDVLAATVFSDKSNASIVDLKYARSEVITPDLIVSALRASPAKGVDTEHIQLIIEEDVQQYTFWDVEDSVSATALLAVSKLLAGEPSSNLSVNQTHDNFIQGGTIKTDIRSSKKSLEAFYPIEQNNVAFVREEKLLKEIAIVKNIKDGCKLIVKLPGTKDEDLEKKLSSVIRNDIKLRRIQLFVLDPTLSALLRRTL